MLKAKNYDDGLIVCNYLLDFDRNLRTEIRDEHGDAFATNSDVITTILRCETLRGLGRNDEANQLIERLVYMLYILTRSYRYVATKDSRKSRDLIPIQVSAF